MPLQHTQVLKKMCENMENLVESSSDCLMNEILNRWSFLLESVSFLVCRSLSFPIWRVTAFQRTTSGQPKSDLSDGNCDESEKLERGTFHSKVSTRIFERANSLSESWLERNSKSRSMKHCTFAEARVPIDRLEKRPRCC